MSVSVIALNFARNIVYRSYHPSENERCRNYPTNLVGPTL